MKHICIVNFNAYSLFNSKSAAPLGGAELNMYLISQFFKKKMKVSLVTGDWGQGSLEKRKGVSIYKGVKFAGSYIIELIRFWRILKKINADIYLSSGAGPEVGVLAIFCKAKKKRYVYRTASDIDVDGSYIKIEGFFRGLLFEYGLKHADTIVVSVYKHKAMIQKKYPNIVLKIVYIPLAIPNVVVRRQKEKDTVLWVSRCVSMKNPDIFLDIAEHFPYQTFVLICPRQPQESELYDHIKDRAGNIKNVIFHEFVPFTKIGSFFAEAKIFVNTSDYEGFTLTLLQSGVAGTPVAYLNVDPDDVIAKFKLGVFANGNFQRLIDGLRLLLSDQYIWNNRSRSITQYVKKNHDFYNVGRQWIELME